MKFAFITLGCKVNQYETQAMEQLLLDAGHEIGGFEEACDGYIINTCSVTAVADKKNRNLIRRCRREHPDAIVAVCGCYTQHDPEAAANLGADLIGGSSNRQAFIAALLAAAHIPLDGPTPRCHCEPVRTLAWQSPESPVGRGLAPAAPLDTPPFPLVDEALKRRSFEILPPGGLEGRTRGMLKVQDGCRNFCTYCIIPYTRGPVRSLPLETAVEQTKILVSQGYREIVVTGIEIASWGVDLPDKPRLSQLLTAICEAAPEQRIRLGSLEPRIITEEFCLAIRALPNLCPHFHLSLQSGSDTVLARMKRKYDTARFSESVDLLKRHFPGCAITTDMIVAFPGETEEEFAQSLAFIEACGFAQMHIFPYSRRPGTPADKMPGQHDNATKEARSRKAIAVAQAMENAYLQSLVGTTQPVLFEEPSGDYFTGHIPQYIKVYAKGENLHNRIENVTLIAPYQDGMLGEIR